MLGILEIDFLQPAHDKQEFERNEQYQRLEAKLKKLHSSYWNEHGDKVGYVSKKAKRPQADDDYTPAASSKQRQAGGSSGYRWRDDFGPQVEEVDEAFEASDDEMGGMRLGVAGVGWERAMWGGSNRVWGGSD